MKPEIRILKNTVVMIVQPLFLNLLSLLVIGYIARKMGVNDFGVFNLALLFSTLFYPLGLMGLNTISIRDISRLRVNQSETECYVGRMLSLRIVIFVLTFLAIVLFGLLMQYPARITQAIYISAVIVAIQLFSEAVCDVFTAFERMEYTALISLTSGLILTGLSVLVLYRGYGLFEVLAVYALGHLTGSVAAIMILSRRFLKVKLQIDFPFWKEKIIQGLPFITMSLIWAGMIRLDTIILSKVVTPADLGLYTAGMLLITKLDLIPGAAGNSVFPAISNLFGAGKREEIKSIIGQTFSFLAILVFPICIGTTLCGDLIVRLIFGIQYEGAGKVLSIAIWAFMLRSGMQVEFSILTAINKQRKALQAYLIAGGACLVLNMALTIVFKINGALGAFMGSQLLLLILFTTAVNKELPGILRFMMKEKIIYLNAGLLILLLLLRSWELIPIIIISGVFYLIGLFTLQIITRSQIQQIRGIYGK